MRVLVPPNRDRKRSILEGEINAAADLTKIIARSLDHAEADIVDPTDVGRDSCLQTGSKLANCFGVTAVVNRVSVGNESIRRNDKRVRMQTISFSATEDRSYPSPSVRRKACA